MSGKKRRRKKRPTKADRELYDRAIDVYLNDCFIARSVARVSEIAERLERNRPTLSRRGVELFGRPLGHELRARQLDYAVKLLRSSPLTVEEVAAEAAFGHRTSFFRLFKRRFGCTPTQFRARQRNATTTK